MPTTTPMADEALLDKVHGLSDLELALLLSLISREHCILSTAPSSLDDLVEELQQISSKTFGLSCAVLTCTPQTTLDDFATSLLLPHSPPTRTPSPLHTRTDYFYQSDRLAPLSPLVSPPSNNANSNNNNNPPISIANVILARNLHLAPLAVQIQALELLRTRRIFTRTSVQAAPRTFLFIPVLGAESGGRARVAEHLNDFFFVAHWHDVEDGFPYLEGDEGWDDGDDEDAETGSTESVVKKSTSGDRTEPKFAEADISRLAELSREVQVDVDVLRYQMNVVSFLRMHRAVAGGVSPTATKHLEQLVKCLAPLHKIDYVTPALVALAIRKIYLHRIRIVKPESERSIQWGSKLKTVEAMLEHIGPEEVIEDVLDMVTAPL